MRQIVLIAIVFLFSGLSYGQATRTWVSSVGDDANPCSRTAPCKTFAGATSKTATNGEINCLDPAGYGAVTLIKSITIDCTGTFGSILATGTTGVIINAHAGVVRLRGLQINGAGTGINGIKIMTAGKVYVENTVIDGFTQNGITVETSGDAKAMIVIDKSSIRNNAGSGVTTTAGASADIAVSNSLLSGNGKGISFTGNASGPPLAGNSVFRLSGNTIVYNTTGLSGVGKMISYKNNTIDGNETNGTPTSSVTQQ